MNAEAVGARINMNSTGMGLKPLTYVIPDWGQLDTLAHHHSDLTIVIRAQSERTYSVEIRMMI